MSKITLYLVLCFAVLQTACSSLLYYPSQNLFYPPEQFHQKPDEVFIPSKNGNKIFAWYFSQHAQKKAKAVLVFYHGNGENLSSHYITLLPFLEKGYDFFIFDYQGYGRSEGNSPSPQTSVEDGEAALRWVHANKKDLPIAVFAQSLGGAVAMRNIIDLKKEIPIQYIVIDSSFSSYKEVAQKVLKKSWVTWAFQWLPYILLSDAYAPGEEVSKISPIPMLIVHGTRDRAVDFSLGEKIFSLANDPKEFWRLEEGTHIDAFQRKDPKYRNDLVQRLDAVFFKLTQNSVDR